MHPSLKLRLRGKSILSNRRRDKIKYLVGTVGRSHKMITVDFTEGVKVFTSRHKGRSFTLGITSGRGWADGTSTVGCLNFYS